MPDYKELFYKSQAALADAIEAIEQLTDQLRDCMEECEEKVIAESEER